MRQKKGLVIFVNMPIVWKIYLLSDKPMTFETEIYKRRTFAIISHPDAGKTTLTEKLLLFGGAIQLAGAVKAKGDRRRARSDWMKVGTGARYFCCFFRDDI